MSQLSHGSDHYPFFITFPLALAERNKIPLLKHNTSNNEHWPYFTYLLNNKYCSLPEITAATISECSHSLVTAIIECADNAFPLKNTVKGMMSPWLVGPRLHQCYQKA